MSRRSGTKLLMIWKKPLFTSPSMADLGTFMSVKKSSAVSLLLRPTLSSLRLTSKPGVFVSTMNSEMPAYPASFSVFAATMIQSARAPFDMKILFPLMTYESPSSTAVVRIDATSLPASGSVMARAPRDSPFAAETRYFCFCSSFAWPSSAGITTSMWTPTAVRNPLQPLRISSSNTATTDQ